MACRLTGAKPLFEPMLEYFQLDPGEQISMKFSSNTTIFIQENAFENAVWKMTTILSRPWCTNSLPPPGGSGSNLKYIIFKLITKNSNLGTYSEIVLMWMSQNLINDS